MFEKCQTAIESTEHWLLFSSSWTSSKQTTLCIPLDEKTNIGVLRCISNHHKLSGLQQQIFIIWSFQGSRVQAWFTLVFCSGSHQAAIEVLARAGVSSGAQGPLPRSLAVGRIPFLVAAELLATCFFKAGRRISLVRKGSVPLLKNGPNQMRPNRNNLSFD